MIANEENEKNRKSGYLNPRHRPSINGGYWSAQSSPVRNRYSHQNGKLCPVGASSLINNTTDCKNFGRINAGSRKSANGVRLSRGEHINTYIVSFYGYLEFSSLEFEVRLRTMAIILIGVTKDASF